MSDQASPGAIKSGESYVEFVAVDGKLGKSLSRLEIRLKTFGTFATKAGALLSAAGASAAGGILALGKSFADAGSAVDDMSQRTGVAVKFISEMRYATQMSGTSIEAFEKGVVAMSRALYGADLESKEAIRTLSNLGLSISDLKNLTPDQAFLSIAEALSKIEDPTKRTALAMRVFGKSGTELIPMLSGGRKGIEDLMRAASKLGISMSAEDAQAAAALGDALDELQMAIGGVKNAVGAAVAGPLTDWANWFRDQIPAATEWVREHQGAVVLVGKLAGGLAIAGSALTAFGIAGVGVGLGFTKAMAAAGGLMKALAGMGGALRVAGMASIAAVAYGIAAAIKHWAGNQDELNRQMAITNRLNHELADKDWKKTQKGLDENRSKASLGDRRKDIDDKIAAAEKNLKGSSDWAGESRRQLNEASGWWNGTVDLLYGSGNLDSLRQDIKDADARVESQRQSLEALREEQSKIIAEQEKYGREPGAKSTSAWAGRMGKKAFAGAKGWGQGVLTQGTGLFEAAKELAKKAEDGNAEYDRDLASEAERVKEANKTPEEKRKERLSRLDEMMKAGKLSERDVALERAKIGLEATQEKADTLAKRVENRESLNVGISDDQKNLLAAQAGRMSVEDETRKNTGETAKTLDEVLAEQRRLNAWLTANGVSLVEVGATS